MASREFLFSLRCRYGGDDNRIDELEVFRDREGEREAFRLDLPTPGLEVFCYALFTCQHTHLRLNCAENGLLLDRVEGEMHLSADDNWRLQRQFLSFALHLRAGQADAQRIDHLIERMQQCPVSKNLQTIPDNRILLATVDD